MIFNQQATAQCRDVKKSLKHLNNNKLDSSISTLKRAEKVLIENGIESVNEKCLSRMYFLKGATNLTLGKKADSLSVKLKYFKESASNYRKFIKLFADKLSYLFRYEFS